MRDLFFFDRLIVPQVITVLYWLALAWVVISGLAAIFHGHFLRGLFAIIFGAIASRVWSEVLVVLFKINEGIQRLADKP